MGWYKVWLNDGTKMVQSMVKCKRNKIDIYYNRGVPRFNISRDFRPPSSNLI